MFVKIRTYLSDTLYSIEKYFGFKNEVKWFLTIFNISFHIIGAYWCYHYTFPVKWQTVAFAIFLYYAGMIGITCGVHRYWSHKSYKATLPAQVLLLLCYTSSGQIPVLKWVRDHRVHHKYSDTEADPHNSHRGFFFSHIGWFFTKKNEEVLRRGNEIDFSDVYNDPLIMWQYRNFTILKVLLGFVLPTMTGVWLWNEEWKCAVAWQCFIRFLSIVHSEFSINSLAHFYGYKPYNKNIQPTQNWFVSLVTFGEGWHNYHHAFPFDYKAAESCDFLNLSANVLRLLARLGLVYDLREATPDMVKSMAKRQGDGTPIRDASAAMPANETPDCK